MLLVGQSTGQRLNTNNGETVENNLFANTSSLSPVFSKRKEPMQPNTPIPLHPLNPENDLGNLSLRFVALEIRNDYDFSEAHRHDYYEVFFFHKGGGTHLIDFVAYNIPDFSVHLVVPGQVHLLRRATDSHGAVVHFSKETASHLQAANSLLQTVQRPVQAHSPGVYSTIKLMLQLLEAELFSRSGKEEILSACLDLLLLKSISPKHPGDIITGSKHLQEFIAFRQLTELHYRTGKLPNWYATQMHITEKRLNEVCKTASGITVSNYLKDRLVLEAKRLLCHSNGSIKEIGYFLGFEDPAYFTRFFRKNTGMTAGDFKAGL